MKTLARFLIYVMFMASAVAVMVYPFWGWIENGRLSLPELLASCVMAFALVFCGTEASERMKGAEKGGGKNVQD